MNKEKTFLNESQEETFLMVQESRNDLLTFCQLIDKKFEVAWFHELIAKKLELALKNVPPRAEHDFVHGMELIYSQLFSILENQGITVMETAGKKFDPYLHEALLKSPSELPENTIIEEFQKGFLLQGQVIRHAKVKISAGMKNGIKKEKE